MCTEIWHSIVYLLLQVGKCKSLHVLTLRENELIELPEEIGQLEELTVLDVAGNKLTYLPASLSNLKNLDALWIDGSQVWLSSFCLCCRNFIFAYSISFNHS